MNENLSKYLCTCINILEGFAGTSQILADLPSKVGRMGMEKKEQNFKTQIVLELSIQNPFSNMIKPCTAR